MKRLKCNQRKNLIPKLTITRLTFDMGKCEVITITWFIDYLILVKFDFIYSIVNDQRDHSKLLSWYYLW